MAEFVSVATRARVAVVTLSRPARRNALNLQVKRELVDALEGALADAEVAAIVLTGAGGYFVAGTDIAEMADMRPIDHVLQRSGHLFEVVRGASKPIIAAVEGYALGGGCELALACDLIVAAEDARFGQPEIKVGIMPGAGGTQRLLRAAGRYKAALWALTGEMIPASEAYAANLVSRLVPSGQALDAAREIALQIARMPPLAVQAIREALRLGADTPLDTALSLERRLFERLFDTADQREGMRAFLEKRAAVFGGR
ncbi:enoyl-CoA hydratase-related protein [Pseudoxanthomonas sp. X-1]|uniref:enoyl-CoA hydratase-related protein n=1 Tax=Pseudoxanthomonas sp. X-1 TaxID=2571115 RepID=UPI00110B9D6C|nr:enoyl-CoA hydratase-related protein [Pseudoxanthomonas sp. X-1]TMN25174.1 enoyl-CoA hydratase [Pseudoxanthomonas sp. X-1]UAY74812.1 enoyl-CoA hydratase/isomerase family protein [Pseudoxanthomonas sp. X-1]